MKSFLVLLFVLFISISFLHAIPLKRTPSTPFAKFLIPDKFQTVPYPHMWEKSVGSCHALTGLREDYRIALKQVKQDLGFQMVRFHGLLNDDMSVYLPNTPQKYNFYNIDNLFDFFLSIGMKPLVELGFMPTALASGNQTVFYYKGNVTPPKDWNAWYDLIRALVQHLVNRYGVEEIRSWPFEIWNEPNLMGGFWSGTQAQYFQLYNYTARAIKSVDSQIRTGGPAVAGCCDGPKWVADFIAYCKANQVPFDFISAHAYPTDNYPQLSRDELYKMLKNYRDIVGQNIPLYITEFNSGLGDFGGGATVYQDSPYAAPFLAKSISDVLHTVDILSYWTFSDIFEEGGLIDQPFKMGFGLMTLQNVPKPAYRALQLMHRSGTDRILISPPAMLNSTVDVIPIVNREKKEVMIFIANFDVPSNPQNDVTVQIQFDSQSTVFGPYLNSATVQRIDNTHANPLATWQQMGSPLDLSKEQIAKLMQASQLKEESIAFDKQSVSYTLNVPSPGLAVITLRCNC